MRHCIVITCMFVLALGHLETSNVESERLEGTLVIQMIRLYTDGKNYPRMDDKKMYIKMYDQNGYEYTLYAYKHPWLDENSVKYRGFWIPTTEDYEENHQLLFTAQYASGWLIKRKYPQSHPQSQEEINRDMAGELHLSISCHTSNNNDAFKIKVKRTATLWAARELVDEQYVRCKRTGPTWHPSTEYNQVIVNTNCDDSNSEYWCSKARMQFKYTLQPV